MVLFILTLFNSFLKEDLNPISRSSSLRRGALEAPQGHLFHKLLLVGHVIIEVSGPELDEVGS